MDWYYLSPHPDDIALSCGGLIYEQVAAGQRVFILTICCSDPPAGALSPFAEVLHTRWGVGIEAVAWRRAEDAASSAILGATLLQGGIPDCIYRLDKDGHTHLYTSEEALFARLKSQEEPLVEELGAELSRIVPVAAQLVCPLAIGEHVDHQLVRQAARTLGRPLLYYADYPYILQNSFYLPLLQAAGWRSLTYPVSADGLEAWIQSIAAHRSQISTFWPDTAALRAALVAYCQENGGVRLWQAGNLTIDDPIES